MKDNRKIKIEFGIPEYGWLQVHFIGYEFELKLEVSAVPIDPMKQLCDVIVQICKEMVNPSKITWHLEPKCYYFQLEQFDNNFKLKIYESQKFDSPVILIKEFLGDFENIILPLYEGLMKFVSSKYKEPHWPESNMQRIKELTELIKNKKHNKIKNHSASGRTK